MNRIKPLTERDCLLEIERIARLIAYSKQDIESLEQCRKCLNAPLVKVAELRVIADARKKQKEADSYAKKIGIKTSSDRRAYK